jgi:phosphoribosylaminoimidazole-succinocarboxamide synthase
MHSILQAQQAGALNAQVYHVIANKQDVPALDINVMNEKGINVRIPIASILIWDKQQITREQYDQKLAEIIFKQNPDLIILAGFMHILSDNFFQIFKSLYCNENSDTQPPMIINLHPALPGKFPGAHGIRDAFEAYQRGEISYTGSMVHEVIPKIDAGRTILQNQIPIYPSDTLEKLETRVKYHEKGLILNAIQKCLSEMTENPISQLSQNITTPYLMYRGKVRDIWDLGYHRLALISTNRTSSFDRHITNVPNKGSYLTQTSAWWFRKTKNIIPNHMIHTEGNVMIVKKCRVIPIEVVVRAYITGSTKTSLWTHYEKGVRKYCGIKFPDNLEKNQKLSQIVVTPTTKGTTEDIPVSPKEITQKLKIIPQHQYDYIQNKAIQLFEYASKKVAKIGLILVDTKFEFGIDTQTNDIILIDEVFTPDSSRFWDINQYQEYQRANNNHPPPNPKNLDKDLIRHYVRSQIEDPYTQQIPSIPEEILQRVEKAYSQFFDRLYNLNQQQKCNPIRTIPENRLLNFFDSYFLNYHTPSALVLTDIRPTKSPHLTALLAQLKKDDIYVILEVIKTPICYSGLPGLLEDYEEDIRFHNLNRDRMVAITVIDRVCNNFLTQMVSQEMSIPVLSCPNQSENRSQEHIPEGVPVAVITNPINCAKFIKKIIRHRSSN